MVSAALEDLDRDVYVESGLGGDRPSEAHLIVSPSQCLGVVGTANPRNLELLSRSVLIFTAPMGSEEFELDARLAAASALVIATDQQAATELGRRGVTAEHLQAGYHEILECPGHGQAREKDLAFFAYSTARVEQLIARVAPLVWDRSCDIRLWRLGQALPEGDTVVADRRRRLARSRLVAHVHETETGSFPWPLVMDAVANRCAVLSEESCDSSPLVEFEHYVSAPFEALPGYASGLLADPPRLMKLADDAYRYVKRELHFTSLFARLLPAIREALAQASPRAAGAVSLEVGRAEHESPTQPRHGAGPDSESGALEASDQMSDLSSEKGGVEATQVDDGCERGTDAADALPTNFGTEATPAYSSFVPDVSVVISLYNYGRVVSDAINSVACSTGVAAEIIVVDDQSTDDSVQVVRSLMSEQPWLPLLLVTKAANAGVSAARNTGFEAARCERVFVLDADNLVYPNGLKRLGDALDASGSDMAYGVIDCFDEEDPDLQRPGLLSQFPWDPAELVRGNYVDAMVMLRRSAWAELGGYDSWMDKNYRAMEDWDLWLRMASLGRRGEFVATPVARYRVHGKSMIAGAYSPHKPISVDALFRDLRSRYPGLFRGVEAD
jgi:hypothetical protein